MKHIDGEASRGEDDAQVRRRAWQVTLGGVAAIAAALLTVILVPPPALTHAWDVIWDTGHILIFGTVAVATAQTLRSWRVKPWWLPPTVGLLVSAVLGGLLELEHWRNPGRAAEWIDFWNDLLGAAIFLALWLAQDKAFPGSAWARGAGVLAAGALTLIALVPLAGMVADYRQRQTLFPLLLDADHPATIEFIRWREAELARVLAPSSWQTPADRYIFRLRMAAGEYPGLELVEPWPDWTGFGWLEIDFLVEGADAVDLELRIDDQHHNQAYEDRFNTVLHLLPGKQTVRISLDEVLQGPQHRLTDMQHIRQAAFFANEPHKPHTVYFDNWRLVAREPDR